MTLFSKDNRHLVIILIFLAAVTPPGWDLVGDESECAGVSAFTAHGFVDGGSAEVTGALHAQAESDAKITLDFLG